MPRVRPLLQRRANRCETTTHAPPEPMTRDTRVLVQESWAAVLDHAPAAAEAFYDRLIDIDPQLGRLFRGADMAEQGRDLMRALTRMVRDLGAEPRPGDDPHAPADGWEGAQLMVLAGALFRLLQRGLGEGFTPALRTAWMEFFTTHAAEVREAALGDAGTSRVVPLRHVRVVAG